MTNQDNKRDTVGVDVETKTHMEEMICGLAQDSGTKRMICIAQSVDDDIMCPSFSEKGMEDTEHLSKMVAEYILALRDQTDKTAEELVKEVIEGVNQGGVEKGDE